MLARVICALVLALVGAPGEAETVVAARMLPVGALISPGDIKTVDGWTDGALSDSAQAVGQELRRAVYADRPIMLRDIGAPTLVERNDTALLTYRQGALTITAEGRCLERGGAGEVIRVINTTSHNTVHALIGFDGNLTVVQQ